MVEGEISVLIMWVWRWYHLRRRRRWFPAHHRRRRSIWLSWLVFEISARLLLILLHVIHNEPQAHSIYLTALWIASTPPPRLVRIQMGPCFGPAPLLLGRAPAFCFVFFYIFFLFYFNYSFYFFFFLILFNTLNTLCMQLFIGNWSLEFIMF